MVALAGDAEQTLAVYALRGILSQMISNELLHKVRGEIMTSAEALLVSTRTLFAVNQHFEGILAQGSDTDFLLAALQTRLSTEVWA